MTPTIIGTHSRTISQSAVADGGVVIGSASTSKLLPNISNTHFRIKEDTEMPLLPKLKPMRKELAGRSETRYSEAGAIGARHTLSAVKEMVKVNSYLTR